MKFCSYCNAGSKIRQGKTENCRSFCCPAAGGAPLGFAKLREQVQHGALKLEKSSSFCKHKQGGDGSTPERCKGCPYVLARSKEGGTGVNLSPSFYDSCYFLSGFSLFRFLLRESVVNRPAAESAATVLGVPPSFKYASLLSLVV